MALLKTKAPLTMIVKRANVSDIGKRVHRPFRTQLHKNWSISPIFGESYHLAFLFQTVYSFFCCIVAIKCASMEFKVVAPTRKAGSLNIEVFLYSSLYWLFTTTDSIAESTRSTHYVCQLDVYSPDMQGKRNVMTTRREVCKGKKLSYV